MQRFVVRGALTRWHLKRSVGRTHSPVMSVFRNAVHPSTADSSNTRKYTSVATSKYPYSGHINLHFLVWEEFRNHKGKIQYYYFGKSFGHGGVCFRIPDSDTIAQAGLVLDDDAYQGKRRCWSVLVKKTMTTEWKPESEDDVKVSEYDWHIGAMLHMAHKFAKEFKDYNMLYNNCKHWKWRIVDYMRKNGPPNDFSRMPISHLDDLIRQLLNKGVCLDIFHQRSF